MAHNEAPIGRFFVSEINMTNTNHEDNDPTVTGSGALFLSGGALWYKSDAGTRTELASA